MAKLKQCSWRGCTRIIPDGIKFCEYHSSMYALQEKERYKEYKQRRMLNEKEKERQDFYVSKAWLKIREEIMKSTFYIDIFEYYRTGRIVQGYTVHHIVTLEEDWNSRLDISNLIYLTESNHQAIHKAYERSKLDKITTQKILFGLINRFQKEFF